jgi:DNA-binding transcriptional regulator YdaS (Cro superfamily)
MVQFEEDTNVRTEMTVEEMTALCHSAFGKTWKSQLARELGVYNSTVNRWITGHTPISIKNARAIRDACRQRLADTSTAA